MSKVASSLILALSAALAVKAFAEAPPVGPAFADDAPAAEVNGQAIPFSAVKLAGQEKLAKLQKDYEDEYTRITLTAARDRAARIEITVNELIDDRVLDLEAADKKTSREALMAAVKPQPVTEAEQRAFYSAEQAGIGQPFEQVAPKVKEYLEGQALKEAQFDYLESLRKKYHANIEWQPMREAVEAVGPQLGSQNAPVTIVEFSDFQCPFCRRLAPTLRELVKLYPTQVRLVYRNMPLSAIHHSAEGAAQAGACAAAQGKFWEMHDLMFAEQSSLSLDALKEKARRLKLDSKVFDQCLASDSVLKTVQSDQAAAQRLGLSSTPSAFVNGRFITGALPLYRWQALIDEELQRKALSKGRVAAATQ
jgi:protein-disulfide isomerase